MSKRVVLALVFTLSFYSLTAVGLFAQTVVAEKTVTIPIENSSFLSEPYPRGCKDTWGTSSADLMSVTARIDQGAKLMICGTATQNGADAKYRYFAIDIFNRFETQVISSPMEIGGTALAYDTAASGCIYWSAPYTDDFTFKLKTCVYDATPTISRLIWRVPRQLFVLQLIDPLSDSKKMISEP